jgi:hypothetical protein
MTMLQQQPHPHDDDAVLTVLLAHAAEPVASGFGRTDSSTARTTMTTVVGDRSKSAGARRGSTARSWWTHKTQGNTENQQRERSSSSLLSSRHNKNDRSYRVRMSPLVVLLLTTFSSVLPHWAGRWWAGRRWLHQHHRLDGTAATIRACGSSSNNIITITTTGGSSASEAYHYWYYDGSSTTPRSTTTTATTPWRRTSTTPAGLTSWYDTDGSPQQTPVGNVRTMTTMTTCTMNTSRINASCCGRGGCDVDEDGTTQMSVHNSHDDGKGRTPSPDGGSPLSRRRLGQAAVYHEALVHAAMLVHPDPKRVAILGGGDGVILREVLKHSTVERVVGMETDDERLQREPPHASAWNSDCSDLVGSADSCLDDPRVTIMVADSMVWLMNHFGNETKSSPAFGAVEPFDVIIIMSGGM